MEADEAGTIARLRTLRADLIDPAIARHHGRTVKLMGDGMLLVFDSVVDAVACAAVKDTLAASRHHCQPSNDTSMGREIRTVLRQQDPAKVGRPIW